MRNILYISLDKYLGEWLINRFGEPVVFPAHSHENAIIAMNMQKLPASCPPQYKQTGMIAILAPEIHGKNPSSYNYFSHKGQTALKESIEILFRYDLWFGIMPYMAKDGLNERIWQWCAIHGISDIYREGVRQKFYRIRKSFETYGIILGKKYKKNVDNGTRF